MWPTPIWPMFRIQWMLRCVDRFNSECRLGQFGILYVVCSVSIAQYIRTFYVYCSLVLANKTCHMMELCVGFHSLLLCKRLRHHCQKRCGILCLVGMPNCTVNEHVICVGLIQVQQSVECDRSTKSSRWNLNNDSNSTQEPKGFFVKSLGEPKSPRNKTCS